MNYTLITGASSGLGYELAKIFARNGSNLILVARHEHRLSQIASELYLKPKINILLIPQDLSQPNAADIIFGRLKEWSVTVDTLVNNAGFYIRGAFSETDWKEEQELIRLQCMNHIKLVKLILPEMLKIKSGGILNICSTGSFIPGPYNAIYCATKAFMLSYTEALAEELSGSGIRVTSLCPGGMNTTFQDLSKRNKSLFNPIMDAAVVARSGYNAFMKGKRLFVPGIANKMQLFAVRFLPRKHLTRLTGNYVRKINE